MNSTEFWKLLVPLQTLGREEAHIYLSTMHRVSPMLYEQFIAWLISAAFALRSAKGEPVVVSKSPVPLERVWMLKSIRQDIPWSALADILLMFAYDESALVRAATAEQMALFPESIHFVEIIELLHTDMSELVRSRSAEALVYMRSHTTLPLALALWSDPEPMVRLAILPYFQGMPEQLEWAVGDGCALVRRKALDFALKTFDLTNLERVLRICLHDRDQDVLLKASELWRDHVLKGTFI